MAFAFNTDYPLWMYTINPWLNWGKPDPLNREPGCRFATAVMGSLSDVRGRPSGEVMVGIAMCYPC